MIDCENPIFTKVATALRSLYAGIDVQSKSTLSPVKFPCVSIEEADNYALKSSRDSSSNENHAVVMYEVNVYSNAEYGAKTECKEIFATVNDIMCGMGFTRTGSYPAPTDDNTKYRKTGRYQAIIDNNETIYRR